MTLVIFAFVAVISVILVAVTTMAIVAVHTIRRA